jgi:hypothetical protein
MAYADGADTADTRSERAAFGVPGLPRDVWSEGIPVEHTAGRGEPA